MSRFRRIASAITGADAFRSLARTATSPFTSAADLARGLIPGRRSPHVFKSNDPADRFRERFSGLTRDEIAEQILISFRAFWAYAFLLLLWVSACMFAGQSASHSPLLIIAASWAFRFLVGFILAGLAIQRALINWQFQNRRLGFAEFAREFVRGFDWIPHPPTPIKIEK
jgi:hypothetical protein